MKNKKSWKLSGFFLAVLILIGAVIWVTFTGLDTKDLKKSLEEINSFAKIKLNDYDEYTANDRVKSLIRLLDKANELSSDMNRLHQYGQQELDNYVTEQRMSGVFITDENLSIVLESIAGVNVADTNTTNANVMDANVADVNARTLWKEITAKNYIAEILQHPEETYTERITIENTMYDLAVVPRQDEKGLVIAYAQKDQKTLGDMTLESVFEDFSINMNGVIVACKDDTVVSTNNEALLGKNSKELKEYYGSNFDGNAEGNVRITTKEGTWYGNKDRMGEYVIYIFFPSSQVFMTRSIVFGSYIAIAIFIYLLLLLGRSNIEKTALKQSQKRMRIINALATAYSSITLFDLTAGKAEIIKQSDNDDTVFEGDLFSKETHKKHIRELMAPEFQEEFMQFIDMDTILQRLNGHQSLTCTVQMAKGTWLLSVIVPQRFDKNGNITAVLLANRNVTIEKEKEQEQERNLRNALAVAEHANKAKTNFLNSISHDIRTPMNAVIGFTSLATTHIDNKELVLDYLKKIDVSSRHLLNLINDVLDMSRIESGIVKLEEVNVHLPDVIEELQPIIQGDISARQQKLDINVGNIVHEDIITDKLRLNQVLLNVIGNAIKFTPVGGKINICINENPCNKKGYAGYSFIVKDTGIGMSKEFQEHIFDAFAREQTATKSGIQGTGLGMAISKNIVDMMGGTITVNSETGKGSEFIITIECRIVKEPAKNSQIALTQQKAESDNSRPNRHAGKKILLVEDNELNREIATAILEEAGIIVETVDDGTDAVARMSSADESEYDLILMDIQMPKMDGYTATREIRTLGNNKKANIPIIAMTANAFDEDRQKAFTAGMNAHISKPINIETIMQTLDQIFGEK